MGNVNWYKNYGEHCGGSLKNWKYNYHMIQLPRWLSGKQSACNAGAMGDTGSIPGSRKSPGEGHGNPLQYSSLENPMDRAASWATVQGVAKSRTWSNLAHTMWSSNPTSGHTSRGHRKSKIHVPECSLQHNSQEWKNLNVHRQERIMKMQHIYIMEYYSVTQNSEIMLFAATWIDLETITWNEVRQKKTNIIWYHLHVDSKKIIQMNAFTNQKLTHRHWKQAHGYQRQKGEVRDKLRVLD